MPACLHLYTDDSGTRKLDRSPGKVPPKYDYFVMGGILLAEADEAEARRLHAEFCKKWGMRHEGRHQQGQEPLGEREAAPTPLAQHPMVVGEARRVPQAASSVACSASVSAGGRLGFGRSRRPSSPSAL